MTIKLFAQLTKVDEARREVWGRLVQETPDRSDEIFDYESSKPHFKAWSDSFAEATDGKSLGNLRAMHGKVSAGKLIAVDFVDAEKAIDIGTKVVDENEWTKVLEGCYTGFSIGGSYVGERKAEKIGDKDIKRYTAKPVEASLVDFPCIPTAKFFDIVKADGAVLHKEFRPTDETTEEPEPVASKTTEEPIDVKGTDEEVAAFGKLLNDSGLTMSEAIAAVQSELAKREQTALLETVEEMEKREFSAEERKQAAKSGAALPDGSFPIKTVSDLHNAIQALGRAKDKAKAKAHIIARAKALGASKELPESWGKIADGEFTKGMYNVADFAQLLQQCAAVCTDAQFDLDNEGDDSEIPMQLRNWLGDGIEIFKGMSDEESGEMLAALKARAGVGEYDDIHEAIEAAAVAGDLIKRANDPELHVVELAKLAESELTEDERKPLKSLDDIRKALCDKALAKMSAADKDRLQAAHDHLSAMGAKCGSDKSAGGTLVKSELLDGVAKQLTDSAAALKAAEERIAKLEAQPMPSVVTLRMSKTVTKEQDQQRDGAAAAPVDPNTVELLPADYVKNADGTVDYPTSRMLKAWRLTQEQARA
jgi:hypothetical protein